MKLFDFKEIVLAENAHYMLATNTSGDILYQEHFEPRALTKAELREFLKILASGSFSTYLIRVNNGHILPPDDLSWVENFNLRRLFRAGISRVAYVSPQNIFNSLEMEKEIEPGKKFHIRIFRKMEDAVCWLESHSPKSGILEN